MTRTALRPLRASCSSCWSVSRSLDRSRSSTESRTVTTLTLLNRVGRVKGRETDVNPLWVRSMRRSLQHERDALAGADADPEHAVAGLSVGQLRRQREDVAGAARAERVADGDRAAVGVELLVGDREAVELVGQLAQHTQRLGRERLVDLPDVDVLRRQAGALDRLGDRP